MIGLMRLLVHGDSIGATCPWSELLDDVEVVNRAVVGAKVRDLAGQLDHTRADIALLSIGINDVTDWAYPLELAGYPAAVCDLQARCGDVLIVAPQMRVRPWVAPWLRRSLIDRLAEVQTTIGGTAVPYRMWDWQRDGIHLRASGQLRLAGLAADRLPVS